MAFNYPCKCAYECESNDGIKITTIVEPSLTTMRRKKGKRTNQVLGVGHHEM
jgi:hypothetical protein